MRTLGTAGYSWRRPDVMRREHTTFTAQVNTFLRWKPARVGLSHARECTASLVLLWVASPTWADRRRWWGAPRTSPRVREPTLPPQFFPIPDSVSGRARQRESELPRQHARLSAMMHVMRDHVGKHGGARRPWLPEPEHAVGFFAGAP